MKPKSVSKPGVGPAADPPVVIEVKAKEFKDTCLQLLDQVRDGAFEIVVTKHGQPVARVVPAAVAESSAHGYMAGTVLAQGDIVSADHEAWGDLA